MLYCSLIDKKMLNEGHRPLHMRLANEHHDLIKQAADKEGRTVSGYVRFHILKAAEKTLYFSEPRPGQNDVAVF